jgi:hypothetical protein
VLALPTGWLGSTEKWFELIWQVHHWAFISKLLISPKLGPRVWAFAFRFYVSILISYEPHDSAFSIQTLDPDDPPQQHWIHVGIIIIIITVVHQTPC